MDELRPSLQINNSLKCAGCGALLHFVPGTHTLKCEYCGASNDITNSDNDQAIISVDYDQYVANINKGIPDASHQIVNCANCGSETVLDNFVTADKCPFCTAPLVLNLEGGKVYVRPHYVLPFEINQQQATTYFKDWLKGLWWAPNDLAKNAGINSTGLKGVYLPHWAYDTDTVTDYTGERGDYYYTTESYTETVNGKTETKTRQVRHTRWSHASGTVHCNFNDILVPASKSLPEVTLITLAPWKLPQLVKFDERYMSGFRSETYQIDPQQGFLKAVEQTVEPINSKIRRDIGGDDQRISNTDTDYNNKAIKYLMLPVWVSAYNYNKKVYQFTVNASTGEVVGQRPYSAIKITMAILAALILIAVAFIIYQNANTQQ